MKNIFFLWILVAVIPSFPLSGQEGVYVLGEEPSRQITHPPLFRDRMDTRTPRELFSPPPGLFQTAADEVPSLGFTSDRIWVRFTLKNTTSQTEWFLAFGYTPVDSVVLYEGTANSGDPELWKETELGTAKPFSRRLISYRHLLFPLSISTGESRTYLMGIKTGTSVNLPLTVWRPHSLYEHMDAEGLVLGLFYGIMAVMFFYNLFLWGSLKDKNYLYYLLWLIGATGVQLALNGYGYQYFWQEFPWWNLASTPFFMAFGGFWGLLFARSFLETARRSKILDPLVRLLMAACAAGLLLSLVAPYALAIRFITVVWVILPIFMLVLSVISLKGGFLPARFFLFAWSATFLGTMIFALKSLGLLPTNMATTWAMQVGITLETVLISLGLGDRINHLENQNKAAQNLVISTKTGLLEAFARFVPTQFLLFLRRESVDQVGLGDAVKQEMTILFSDIRNFTTLSEKLSVDDSFRFLNSYFKRMEPVIQENGGFVDKYIGDAIMALFPGVPFQAVEAALGMRRVLGELNSDRAQAGRDPIEMGIGLHCGELMLGTVGSAQRMETTVIGDSVNLCSRLEGLTKEYGVPLLISEAVHSQLPEGMFPDIREIDQVKVKGKDHSVRIYEVFQADPPELRSRKRENLDRFQQALELYRAEEWEESEGLFRDILHSCSGDTVARLYLGRLTAASRTWKVPSME